MFSPKPRGKWNEDISSEKHLKFQKPGKILIYYQNQRGLNTKRPCSSSFWIPRNLSNHMDWQARSGDTVLVKSGWAVVAGGRRGKDDRNQNTLAPLIGTTEYIFLIEMKQG
jgi:hypothetical protein